MLLSAWWLVSDPTSPVTLNPDPTQLPGSSAISQLADGIDGWALIAAVVALVVGAVMWTFSRKTTRRKALLERPGQRWDRPVHTWLGTAPR